MRLSKLSDRLRSLDSFQPNGAELASQDQVGCDNMAIAKESNTMPNPEKNIIKLEPGTLLLIVSALILLPLLFVGFLSQ
ncbi:hypothetical protein NDA01_17005 [Trichocoleus desertorum AS-A10]|uniref:hypothetical protein n=1 Tax=Trichocoleus desertorum TaxID=1481672 RepID=UPI00329A20B4